MKKKYASKENAGDSQISKSTKLLLGDNVRIFLPLRKEI